MTNILLAAHATVMGTTQRPLYAVNHNPHPGAVPRLDVRPQVMQQRLDFPPVYVATYRLLQDAAQHTLMLMTHVITSGVGSGTNLLILFRG